MNDMKTPTVENSNDKLWTSSDLARYLQISESSVERHRASGEGNHPPYLKISDHCVRYVPSNVVSWAERNSSARN